MGGRQSECLSDVLHSASTGGGVEVEGFFLARLPSYPKVDERIGRSLSPQVAAAAGWLESLKMPMREIYAKYSKSELHMMAWRSGEVASNMQSNHPSLSQNAATPSLDGATLPSNAVSDALVAEVERRLGPVALKLDEDCDLRKLTGEEVLRFMGAQGISLGGRVLAPNPDVYPEIKRGES